MKSNFEWLVDGRLTEIKELCVEAEQGLSVSPVMCSMATRKALENAIKWVFGIDNDLKIPYQETLATLLYDYEFSVSIAGGRTVNSNWSTGFFVFNVKQGRIRLLIFC